MLRTIAIILGGLVLILITTSVIEWALERQGSSFILTFKEFHKHYHMYPDRFGLCDGWARYMYTYDNGTYTSYAIGFGFISWIEYCLWKAIFLHFERKKELNKHYKNFIEQMEGEEDIS